MAQLDISPKAKRDLVEIGLYIAHQSGSQQCADAFLDLDGILIARVLHGVRDHNFLL